MSTLLFDGTAHTLTLLDAQNKQVGQWHANNRVDHRATFHFVPNRTYRIIDPSQPHRHGGTADTLDGPYGRFGIIRLEHFIAEGHGHDGVGVHSGRANTGGADYATMGCIRTTDEAMEAITRHMRTDPIQSITVQNNHVQGNVLPHKGDPHHPVQHPHDDPPQHPEHKHHKAHQPAPHHPAHHKHAWPDYQKLFHTCVIDASHLKEIDHDADKIIKNKARYEALVKSVEGQIPWWFVGLVHKLEAGNSFKKHLHNGDSLKHRTVQVPAGRPIHPPLYGTEYTWEESAEDALRYEKLTQVTDWSLPNALHRLEGYNGFGYLYRGINTPYLWSYSNHYTKGHFTSDRHFDPEAVSRQAGAAVVLKRLIARGVVTLGQ